MEEQGYTIENNLLYQDNKSTILLAKNGRKSARKKSKISRFKYDPNLFGPIVVVIQTSYLFLQSKIGFSSTTTKVIQSTYPVALLYFNIPCQVDWEEKSHNYFTSSKTNKRK